MGTLEINKDLHFVPTSKIGVAYSPSLEVLLIKNTFNLVSMNVNYLDKIQT